MSTKPTKLENLQAWHAEFKAGIGALAKAKLITADVKKTKIAEFDQAFKDLIKEEKAKAKKK